jgi:hypothetical protein
VRKVQAPETYRWTKVKKVKVTLVQALRLCTGRTAHSGSRGITLTFRDHGTRREWGVSVTPRQLFTPGKNPLHIVQKAGWAPGPVWTGTENFAPTGIGSRDRPARSQSLYRLRYLALYRWTKLRFFYVEADGLYNYQICLNFSIRNYRMGVNCSAHNKDEKWI